MIDTHAHLTFPDYADRMDEVLAHAASAGVMGVITIATTTVDSHDTLRLANEHENIWCSAGVHPLYADQEPHDWNAIKEIAKQPKCVAWGELGLDNKHARPHRSIQDRVLADELAFIESCKDDGIDLPIVVHCREAFEDLLPILRATTLEPSRFVFHCFTGNPDEAKQVLDFGAMISFTGVVTYNNAKAVAEAAKLVPNDRILVETDAPFLSPDPKRGTRPCLPAFARYTAEFIANLRSTPFPEFHEHIDRNTESFFQIDIPKPANEIIETPCTC
jgi:TatD DNase family protein